MAPPGSSLKFAEGEKVIAYHQQRLYVAKILKYRVNAKDSGNEMHLHYNGWSKKWDEWVPEQRILKYNEANLARMKELQDKPSAKQSKGKIGKAGRPSTGKDKTADVRSEGSVHDSDSGSSTPILELKGRTKIEKKRQSVSPINDQTAEIKKAKRPKLSLSNENVEKSAINIQVPTELIPFFIDDYIMIVKKKKMPLLPSKVTVEDLINDYIEDKKSNSDDHAINVSRCVMLGVKDYFNVLLSSKLLYKEEWTHHSKASTDYPDKPPSQIYGSYHLLRLFIKLGTAATLSNINDMTMSLVMNYIQEFLRFLINSSSKYFSMSNFA